MRRPPFAVQGTCRVKVASLSKLLCTALFALLILGGARAHAQTAPLTQVAPAGPHRPAVVPANFVVTPFGYFDPSCVRTLATGDHLRTDGRVQHANGTLDAAALTCSQPHYLQSGLRVDAKQPAQTAGTGATPTINGWIESASVNTGSDSTAYGELTANWIVPRNPATDDGQTVYEFPGFEDIDNTQSILQPVLGYNSGAWTIASWNCCISGVTTNSAAVQVTPGDQIYGTVTSNCGAGSLTCDTWNVNTEDLNSGQSTALNDTPSEGQVFNWAFGGVLEVYGINACSDLPPDGQTTYTQINLYDQNDSLIASPQWQTGVNSNEDPSCNYQVNTTAQTVTVVY